MGNVKTAGSRLLAAIMAICLAAVMAASAGSLLVPSKAYADDDAVRATATGVMKFNWYIDGDAYSRGSCFMINNDTVLTAYHCTMFSSLELDMYGYSGQSVQDLRDRCSYSVTINRDVTVSATLVTASEEQDFAVFKLDQPINNHTPLTIRDSSEVKAAETVYAVGFPADSDNLKVIPTYTSEDVTFKSGTISKTEDIYQGLTSDLFVYNGYFLQSNCVISGGDSGGPMIDANGNVVGINVIGDSSYYYAAASDKITPVLDDLGIEYTSTKTPPIPDPVYKLSFSNLDAAIAKANGLDSSEYTEESFKAVSDALAAADEAHNIELVDENDKDEYDEAQASIDAAAKAIDDAVAGLEAAPEGPNMGLIIGIIVAVVVVIAIIVLVLVMRGRSKKKQEDAPTVPLGANTQAAAPAQPALQSGGSQSWQKPGAAASSAGVSETTILDDEASDTVILFQAASGGSLTRMSTNEQIPINSAEFTIGRERSKVNYCLEGNTSISRVHVRILVRDGKVYCVDNKAANGTYINGVKCRPGEEVLLKGGDIITLADEKFKYNA